MNDQRIKPEQLSDAIIAILEETSAEIKAKVDKYGEEIAKNGVKELKKKSPRYTGNKTLDNKPGSYAKSWTYEQRYQKITGNSSYEIYNRSHYRLTHLLENGHVNRDGSRTRKFVHIEPVNEKVCKDYERKVESALNEL